MSSNSSPFIEHPRRSRISGADMSTLSEDDSTRQTVSNLKFQLESAKIEKQLLQQDKDSSENSYKVLLTKKSEEYNKLKKDFDYLYEEKKAADSKLENQSQIHSTKVKELTDIINGLKKDKSNLSNAYRDVETNTNRTLRRFEQVRSDYNYQLKVNDELTERIKGMEDTIDKLQASNENLVENLNVATKKSQEAGRDILVENLQIKNSNLLKTNSQLQLKVDTLLQNKTSVELLRQKNISLMQKIEFLERVEEKYCRLEIEYLESRENFDSYFKLLDEALEDEDNTSDPETKIKIFIHKFMELSCKVTILNSLHNDLKGRQDELDKIILDSKNDLSEKDVQLSQIKANVALKNEQIQKLEKQNFLSNKEIEFLRKSITQLDKEYKDKGDNKATEQYLCNLESLVDEYKTEIDSLRKHLSEYVDNQVLQGNKRPRSDVEPETNSQRLRQLDTENIQLQTKIREYETTVENLNLKIKNLAQINTKKEQLQILQLKSNPLSKDQIVKQATLDHLRKENNDLISKYVKNDFSEDEETVPRSLFVRQEYDKLISQLKIDQLTKRIKRLNDVYAQKSKDILSTISKYFGYSLEFLPSSINPNDVSSRIKLSSRYTTNGDTEGSSSYVIIDLETKSLKAYGNAEFKELYLELSKTYGKDQIPCFLSALNLQLYERLNAREHIYETF